MARPERRGACHATMVRVSLWRRPVPLSVRMGIMHETTRLSAAAANFTLRPLDTSRPGHYRRVQATSRGLAREASCPHHGACRR